MVDVITRGEPAMMVCHWTGIHWNGEEKGFNVFREVVRRLKMRFDNLLWMKLSDLSRYWAAKELTTITRVGNTLKLNAPFACPGFTIRLPKELGKLSVLAGDKTTPLVQVSRKLNLAAGTFFSSNGTTVACFDLPKGSSQISL